MFLLTEHNQNPDTRSMTDEHLSYIWAYTNLLRQKRDGAVACKLILLLFGSRSYAHHGKANCMCPNLLPFRIICRLTTTVCCNRFAFHIANYTHLRMSNRCSKNWLPFCHSKAARITEPQSSAVLANVLFSNYLRR